MTARDAAALFGLLALLAGSVPASADHVVLNGRVVVDQNELMLNVYRNDGCPVAIEFRRSNIVDGYYQCEGDWDWDNVRKMTRYYRDRLNNAGEVDYFDVVNQIPNTCKKLKYNPGTGC
ncbi:hypothetical protein [Stappia sp. MMSF_3263]|uniref:hypothetical protein n=1 Tax=Stappia sp. MMSF_3263 TaxID=3046693 RepID=UPI00273F22A8|nr:hypothetical protein [Stappia sp. MMSF_3263]